MTRQPGLYAHSFETSEGNIVCRLFEKDAPKNRSPTLWNSPKANASGLIPRRGRNPKTGFTMGRFSSRDFPTFMIQGEIRKARVWAGRG